MFKRIIFCIAFINIFSCTALAEGIIPVICAIPKYKGCKNISEIYKYNWIDYPYNWDGRPGEDTKPPVKVYAFNSDSIFEYNWQDYPYNWDSKPGEVTKPPIKVYTINSKYP